MVPPTTSKNNENNGGSSSIYSNVMFQFARNTTSTYSNDERYENVISILDQVIALVHQDEQGVDYGIDDADGSIDGDSLEEDERLEDMLMAPIPHYGVVGGGSRGGGAHATTRANLSLRSNTEELEDASWASSASAYSSLFYRYESSPSSSPHIVTTATTPPTTPTTTGTASISTTTLAINSTVVAVSNNTDDGGVDSDSRQPATVLSEDEIEEENEEEAA